DGGLVCSCVCSCVCVRVCVCVCVCVRGCVSDRTGAKGHRCYINKESNYDWGEEHCGGGEKREELQRGLLMLSQSSFLFISDELTTIPLLCYHSEWSCF